MNELVDRISEHMATATSRGGFIAALGKIAIGGAAALAGVSSLTGGPEGALASGNCCACSSGCTNGCPPGTILYTSTCCSGQCGDYYLNCYACLSGNSCVCGWSQRTNTKCPCAGTS